MSLGGHEPPARVEQTPHAGPAGAVEDAGPPVAVRYAVRITPRLVWSIVAPYAGQRIAEQLKAVAPIGLALFLFHWLVLRLDLPGAAGIALGLGAVILGLAFFIEGLRLGVMPLGENIGSTLPAKAGLAIILTVAFLLGTIATFAEPAIATLTVLGGSVPPAQAPQLFDFLNRRAALLLFLAAVGVGLGALNGIVRFLRGWSLKLTLLPGLSVAVALTLVAALDGGTRDLIGLAWDAGGITTGTVTAPLVLALGVGMARALGKSETGMSGFGLITLCSLWPIALVLAVALASSWSGTALTASEYAALAPPAARAGAAPADLVSLVAESFRGASTSLLPLIALLLMIQVFVLRDEVRDLEQVILGVAFALLGLALFKVGLVTGLTPLGDQVGARATLAFSPEGGLYGSLWGRLAVLLFAFVAGYGASLAEPALASLGLTVEEVTAGAFKKYLVTHAVAFGVGVGLVIGIARIMFGWSSLAVVAPSYLLVLLLTAASDEKYVCIGWDSGGVTTGDITSPVLIALGLGVATAVGGGDGFSLIAMGSVWPIIAVLVLGLVINRTTPAVRPPEA